MLAKRIASGRSAGLGILALAVAGCSVNANTNMTGNWGRFGTDQTTIAVISAVVGEKNVFIPSTIVVTDGAPTTLSVFNTTDKPHGFAIDGLGIEVVLPAGEEFQIPLPPLTGGQIYGIHCQLHPPHRSASLVVLPSN